MPPWFAPGRLQIRFVPWALSLSLAGLSHDSLALKRAAVSTLVLQAALRILSLEVETAAATTPGWLSDCVGNAVLGARNPLKNP